jgi:hypothetical protein
MTARQSFIPATTRSPQPPSPVRVVRSSPGISCRGFFLRKAGQLLAQMEKLRVGRQTGVVLAGI